MDHAAPRHARYDSLLNYLWIFTVCLALLGFSLDSRENILKGLIAIVMTENALITDYFLVAGPGAALVNSALVTSISLVLLPLTVLAGAAITLLCALISKQAIFGYMLPINAVTSLIGAPIVILAVLKNSTAKN